MVSHTETVKKHQRGTISPPQKRYPNWNTPRAVEAKGVRITGVHSAVVSYSSAERLPEEKSENKPRRQTWSLQFEIDSQIKSSTEINTRIVEKSYRKGTVPEMTRFPNRRLTIPAAYPIELMVGHSSEAFSQQTNFTYKRSREQETQYIQFPNKCTRTSTTMSSRTQEVERKVQQRGSLISDSFSTKYRSNSARYRDRQSKTG
ncbi:hypothetical protein TNCT_652531 [Trichonephila clavata]|uniref:Uncharacterized protein n=1 Tax=Trichonephila clavata TaxID=2740835 RepID=A0A8X6L9H7_TRICU|nr:hypothetical protein TNCT_652531 [Trichonephila clavata]